jgi:dipeptidyl-peptidase-4
LYVYDREGSLTRRLTEGALHIDEVRGVEMRAGMVYVEGWHRSPLERHLYQIPLGGGPAHALTREPGYHQTVIAPDGSSFVDAFSSTQSPPVVTLRDMEGGTLATLQAHAAPDPRLAELDLPPPEFVTVTARDGETLHGALYRPHGLPPGGKAPVLVQVYGGPHVQTVQDHWSATVNVRAQYMASLGYLVFRLDNRGSARRGLAFEAAISGNAGDIEVRDQVDGVRFLASLPEADTSRVGVYGWSYGGYMALMCLARAPEVFSVAVAGAPVTDWDGYDTHYTERYMGIPADNPDGYRSAAVMTHAANIRGSCCWSTA